jgi:hypothetical protein
MTGNQNTALMRRTAALRTYVNEQGGSLIVLTQAGLAAPYGFLPQPLTFVRATFIDVTVVGSLNTISPDSDSANLDHDAWHGYFTGPINYGGIFQVLVRDVVHVCTPYILANVYSRKMVVQMQLVHAC